MVSIIFSSIPAPAPIPDEELESIFNSMITALKMGINKVVPDQISTTVEVIAKTPESIKDLQGILSNDERMSQLATLAFQSGIDIGNTGLAVGGGAILLKSGKNLVEAKNRTTRIFYALSMMCSGTGTVSSTLAVYCEKCGLSRTGMIGG